MAFSDIEKSEKLDIIDIAIVENEEFENNYSFKNAFETLSDENNENRLFDTKYVTEEEAKKLLDDDKIDGYLKIEENSPKVIIQSNGINQTVLKYVVDEVSQSEEIINNLVKGKIENYIGIDIDISNISNVHRFDLSEINKYISDDENYINSIYTKIYNEISDKIQNSETKIKDISNNNLSYTMIEFYTLIAMACLYGGILGMYAINKTLANMAETGKRIAVSKVPKGIIVLSSILSSFIVQLIGLALLFIYTVFVLKVDYGNNLPLIILLGIVGSFAGLTMGVAISSALKSNENTKTGIVIAVTMFGCFLSGMMGITMKYLIDKNIPLLNKINPASMITDGFYSLYYYDTSERFWFNVASLLIFAFVMIVVSYSSLRRQKYDSI